MLQQAVCEYDDVECASEVAAAPIVQYDFQALCLPLQPELLGFARKLCGGDGQRAADVVQDALVKALLAWSRWIPDGDAAMCVRGWLYRIVSNVFATDYQRRKYQASRLDGHRDEVMLGVYGREDGQAFDAEGDHPGDEVTAAIDALDPPHREMIVRKYIQGQEYKQIARELRIPLGTVNSRLNRARAAMRISLRRYARSSYRLDAEIADRDGSGGAGVDAEDEALELLEADADCVERVVAERDDRALAL